MKIFDDFNNSNWFYSILGDITDFHSSFIPLESFFFSPTPNCTCHPHSQDSTRALFGIFRILICLRQHNPLLLTFVQVIMRTEAKLHPNYHVHKCWWVKSWQKYRQILFDKILRCIYVIITFADAEFV